MLIINKLRNLSWKIRYNIKDEKDRIEIAKIAAKSQDYFSEYIQYYDIKDQQALISIAKIAAKNQDYFSEYIQYYDIKDEKDRIEIAKIAALTNAISLSEYILNYDIKNPDALTEIAYLAVQTSTLENDSFKLWKLLTNYGLNTETVAKLKLLCCYLENVFHKEMQTFVDEYDTFLAWPVFKETISDIERRISTTNDNYQLERLKRQRQKILFGFLFIEKECNPIITLEKEEQQWFTAILKYHNPKDALFLMHSLMQNLRDPQCLSKYKALISSSKGGFIQHLILPMIIVSQWFTRVPYAQEQIKQIKKFMMEKGQRKSIRDAKGFLPNLLQALLALSFCSTISGEQKIYLLHECCKFAKSATERQEYCRKRSINLISILAKMNLLAPMLHELGNVYNFKQINNYLIQHLQIDIFCLTQPISNFEEKFFHIEESLREPLALVKYVSGLKNSEPRVFKEAQRLVVNILENKIGVERYKTDNNPHLKKIEEGFSKIFTAWKAPQIATEKMLGQIEETSIDFLAFLQQKILTDKHFPQAPKQLLEYLENPAIPCSMTNMQENEIKILIICKNLSNPSDRKQKSALLKELLSMLEEENELKKDIYSLLKNLSIKKQNTNVLIVDTDDWQDLFLSGTEVLGSCHRIEGSANYNKCLMAYVLDGKNRMLAVIDPISKKILARAIFRLLWNTTNSRPSLFQERIYPSTCPKEYQDLLNDLAESRATELGLELFTYNSRNNLLDTTSVLSSLGSSSPYEYSDASNAIIKDGIFTIYKAFRVLLEQS